MADKKQEKNKSGRPPKRKKWCDCIPGSIPCPTWAWEPVPQEKREIELERLCKKTMEKFKKLDRTQPNTTLIEGVTIEFKNP